MSDRWLINKLGLINFWYYDEEEFDLSDGKLLLRGGNGSGKSVTMQSFIPLLLDGNKRPERIDPFGTTARKIENYLLVDEEEDERTAYLYIELKKSNSEVYLTIGMGLKAQRGKNVDAWYFIISDGRRVKKDFSLYNNVGYEKIALTKKELKNRIASGGFYTEEQGEYKRKVNEFLFGYSDIENYDELINLLINIRSPKLSKDFKPTVIYEILENSLRQLSEDDLRPMSEAMENMDNIKLRIEQLENCQKSLKQIDYYYSKYNKYILHDKAKKYSEQFYKLKELNKEKVSLDKLLEELSKNITMTENEILNLEEELKCSQSKIEEYSKSDLKNTKEKLESVKNEIDVLSKEKEDKSKAYEDKKSKLRQKENKKKDIENEIYEHEKQRQELLEEMDEYSKDCSFKNHDLFRDDFNILTVREAFKRHRNRIKDSLEVLNKFENKKIYFEDILHQRDNKLKDIEHEKAVLNESEEYLTTVKEEQAEKIVKWKSGNKELLLNDEVYQATVRSVMQVEDYLQINSINQVITDLFNENKGVLIADKGKINNKIDDLNNNINEISMKIKELKEMKEIEFNRSEEVIQNRENLKAIGIPFIPLYKAIDFQGNVNEKTKERIESALFDMGIMDALIIPKKYQDKVLNIDNLKCDKYLFSESNFLVHSISEYLKVDSTELENVKYEDVDCVLSSILLDKNKSAYIDENGNYGIGILNGKASSNYEVKYIGTAARKNHRERQIEQLKLEINDLNEQIAIEKNGLNKINERISLLEKEYKEFPNYEDLKKAIEIVNEASSKLRNEENALEIINKNYEKIENEVKELKKLLYQVTDGIEIDKNSKAYKDADNFAGDYEYSLNKFESISGILISKNENIKSLSEDIEECKIDIDTLIYELNKKVNC